MLIKTNCLQYNDTLLHFLFYFTKNTNKHNWEHTELQLSSMSFYGQQSGLHMRRKDLKTISYIGNKNN